MKILCPFHEDSNPSMELYPDGHGYCFVCGKSAQIKDEGDPSLPPEKEPEDLHASIRRIKELPVKQVRGLWLHFNESGYFILWPNDTYYKLRRASGNPRYLAPTGHTPPLFYLRNVVTHAQTLLIIEGELNAMSAYLVLDETDVISPGSATNFLTRESELLELAEKYDRVVVWTDNDSAGIKAIWSILPRLTKMVGNVTYIVGDEDANDLLVQKGYEGLKSFLTIERNKRGVNNG